MNYIGCNCIVDLCIRTRDARTTELISGVCDRLRTRLSRRPPSTVPDSNSTRSEMRIRLLTILCTFGIPYIHRVHESVCAEPTRTQSTPMRALNLLRESSHPAHRLLRIL